MSKTTRMITVPAKEIEVSSYTCDRCGEASGLDEEPSDSYGVSNVRIRMEEGTAYPEGRSLVVTEIDCCAACFKKFVLPALEAIGFAPRAEYTD